MDGPPRPRDDGPEAPPGLGVDHGYSLPEGSIFLREKLGVEQKLAPLDLYRHRTAFGDKDRAPQVTFAKDRPGAQGSGEGDEGG